MYLGHLSGYWILQIPCHSREDRLHWRQIWSCDRLRRILRLCHRSRRQHGCQECILEHVYRNSQIYRIQDIGPCYGKLGGKCTCLNAPATAWCVRLCSNTNDPILFRESGSRVCSDQRQSLISRRPGQASSCSWIESHPSARSTCQRLRSLSCSVCRSAQGDSYPSFQRSWMTWISFAYPSKWRTYRSIECILASKHNKMMYSVAVVVGAQDQFVRHGCSNTVA